MNAERVESREISDKRQPRRRAGGVSPLMGPSVRTHAAAVSNSRLTPTARRQALDSRLSTLDHTKRGFTLVELLVVIAIIAILISILGVVLANMGQQAKEAATNKTIKQIHVLLEQRTEAFDRAMNQIEKNPKNEQQYKNEWNRVVKELSNMRVPASTQQVKILVRKRFKQSNFPQTFSDAGITAPAGHVAETESSEMLYFMLTQGEVGGVAPVDAGEFLASEVADTDGDGLLEFIDAWGKPLRFYRWPTRLFKSNGIKHTDPDPTNPNARSDHDNVVLLVQGTSDDLVDTDPDDPLEILAPLITVLAKKTKNFEALYHTPYTYHVPLIVSAGVDGELGLGEPNSATLAHRLGQVTDASVIADNITNRNQRSGD